MRDYIRTTPTDVLGHTKGGSINLIFTGFSSQLLDQFNDLIHACCADGIRRHNTAGRIHRQLTANFDFVVLDQLMDFTKTRHYTFYDGEESPHDRKFVAHVDFTDPYCPELRRVAREACAKLGIPHRGSGTVVVIEGPRFSTRAESKWFAAQGWEVVNMTQYPEALLARELEMCYVNISLITDYDAGLEGHPEVEPVSHSEVIRVFNENNEKLRALLHEFIPAIPAEPSCRCPSALEGAAF